MKKILTLLVFSVLISSMHFVLGETQNEIKPLINGNFETCDLTGWTAYGDAFTDDVITSQKMFWGNRPFYNEGDCHLFGYLAGEAATGELHSSVFTLDGTGYISFLIGAGKHSNKTFVAIVDAETDFQLFKIGNDYFDEDNFTLNYGRVLIDAREYLGRDLYIKIVDYNDNPSDFAFINVDDFNVNYDPSEFTRTEAPDFSLTIDKANEFINDNKDSVDPYYRMSYHFMAPYGWINDPNGFSFFNNRIHLFYQHNPYSEYWAGMHWGHATSEDFIKWEHLPVALAPDEEYDFGGIYSGSGIQIGDRLYVMYTAILPQPNGQPALQQQAIAYTEDGVHFIKPTENPVITIDMYPPHLVNTIDMRDPKVFEHDGRYYAIIGNNHNGYGQVALFVSDDFYEWEFFSVPVSAHDIDPNNPGRFGINWECPDLFELDGYDVMILSPQIMPNEGPKYTNLHSAIYFVGSMDYTTGKYTVHHFDEIDSGHDFYAPQSMLMPDGRRVVVAWMQDWGTVDQIFTAEFNHGWAGAMTVPRELRVVNGELYTYPIRELYDYRTNQVTYSYEMFRGYKTFEGIEGNVIDLEFTLNPLDASNFGLRVFEGDDEYTVIRYDIERQFLIIERRESSEHVYRTTRREVFTPLDEDGLLTLRILLDRSAVEIFANGGQRSMASLVYPKGDSTRITFFSDDTVILETLSKWDIIVD